MTNDKIKRCEKRRAQAQRRHDRARAAIGAAIAECENAYADLAAASELLDKARDQLKVDEAERLRVTKANWAFAPSEVDPVNGTLVSR